MRLQPHRQHHGQLPRMQKHDSSETRMMMIAERIKKRPCSLAASLITIAFAIAAAFSFSKGIRYVIAPWSFNLCAGVIFGERTVLIDPYSNESRRYDVSYKRRSLASRLKLSFSLPRYE